MTDTATDAPAAGWYDDPSGAAPYRWWDGSHWTPETLQERPEAPTAPPAAGGAPAPTGPPAGPTGNPTIVGPSADGSFPSRRSLREAGTAQSLTETRTSAPSAPGVMPVASYEPASTPPQDAPGVAPPHPGATTSTASPGDTAFTPPTAWVANAPATPVPPTIAFGHGALYGAPAPYGSRAGGLGPADWGAVSADRNLPARWALTLPLLALVLVPVFVGIRVSGVLGVAGVAVALIVDVLALGAMIAGIPLGIVGLVRAARVARGGQIPRGRPHAIIGIVICLLLLAANSLTLVRLLEADSAAQRTATQSAVPAAGATAPAMAPIGATPEDVDGTTTYVYSQALTESAIASAVAQRVHITPGSVQCPTSEPIVIGTTFDCSVALPAAGATSVEVTVVSDQGELEISAG